MLCTNSFKLGSGTLHKFQANQTKSHRDLVHFNASEIKRVGLFLNWFLMEFKLGFSQNKGGNYFVWIVAQVFSLIPCAPHRSIVVTGKVRGMQRDNREQCRNCRFLTPKCYWKPKIANAFTSQIYFSQKRLDCKSIFLVRVFQSLWLIFWNLIKMQGFSWKNVVNFISVKSPTASHIMESNPAYKFIDKRNNSNNGNRKKNDIL